MLTIENTYVHASDLAAVRSLSVSDVKRRILKLAVEQFQVPGVYFTLDYEKGQVFSLSCRYQAPVGGITGHFIAEMPLRRLLVVLEHRSRRAR